MMARDLSLLQVIYKHVDFESQTLEYKTKNKMWLRLNEKINMKETALKYF